MRLSSWIAPVLIFFCAALIARTGFAYTENDLLKNQLDPRLSYKTIETRHFSILFSWELTELANRIALQVEDIRQKVLSECHCEFEAKTNIVLVHKFDANSVFTFVYPHNQIFLNATLPTYDIGLNAYTSWYEWVISHEYTHIVHLNAREAAGPLFWLGSWYRPNQLHPAWLKEGIAVEMETAVNRRGRGHSTEYQMMLRMAYLDGLLRSPDFANLDTITNFEEEKWPWTARPYLLGYSIVDTLKSSWESQGKEPSFRLLVSAPPSYLSYSYKDFARIFGFSDLQSVWEKTLSEIEVRAKREIAKIQERDVTSLEYLTDTGFYYFSPILSPDESNLYATFDSPDRSAQVIRLALDKSPPVGKSLFPRSSGYALSISRSGRFLAFDQLTHQNRYDTVSDGYIYDLKTQQTISASPGTHAREIDIHPDGKHLIYVEDRNGENQLVESDTNWEERALLIPSPIKQRLSTPQYSPSGDAIVLSAHNDESGGEDIWLIRDGKFTSLVEDGSFNFSPSWAADGKSIFFTSDRTGVFNVYELKLDSHEIFQITNVLGGVFFPRVDSAKKWIYVTSYRGHGYDLARFEYDRASKVKVGSSLPKKLSFEKTSENLGVTGPASVDYSYPLNLIPQFLHPALNLRPDTIQPGFTLGASDPLFFNSYSLELRYDSETQQPVGRLFWFHSTSSFSWVIDAFRDITLLSGGTSLQDNWTGKFHLDFPLAQDQNNLQLQVGGEVSTPDGATFLYGPSLGVLYDLEFQPLGFTQPTEGALLNLTLRNLRSTPTSSGNDNLLDFSFTRHFQLTENQVLHGRVYGGAFITTPKTASAYWVGGTTSFPFTNDSQLVLYGYPINSLSAYRAAIGDLNYSFRLQAPNRLLGGSPLFLSHPTLGVRLQAAKLESLTSAWVMSAGIEASQHVIAYSIGDFELKTGVYRGDSKFGGETQFYLSIRSL